MKIPSYLEEPVCAVFRVDVINTSELSDTHLFSVSLVGNFGKCESCLHPAI